MNRNSLHSGDLRPEEQVEPSLSQHELLMAIARSFTVYVYVYMYFAIGALNAIACSSIALPANFPNLKRVH